MNKIFASIAFRIARSKLSQIETKNPNNSIPKDPDEASARDDLLDIPVTRQYNNYTCGSASLLAVLGYYGLYEDPEDELVKQLETNPVDGTNADEIVRVAKQFGLEAKKIEGASLEMLEQCMKEEKPVILNFQAWTDHPGIDWSVDYEDGHYAVLIGMDDDHLYFRDPSTIGKIGVLLKSDFLNRWHDEDAHKRVNRMCIVFDYKGEPESDDLEYIG